MLRHLSQIASGPREGKTLLNDILTKAFSNTLTSSLQSLYQVRKVENESRTYRCFSGSGAGIHKKRRLGDIEQGSADGTRRKTELSSLG